MNIKRPKSVKKLFIGFLIYLPLQYMLVGIVGVIKSEPWPAFVLPGFKSVNQYQDVTEFPVTKFYIVWEDDNVGKTEIAPEDLFTGLPNSQMQGFIRNNFRLAEFDAEAKHWLKQRVSQLYPDSSAKALELAWGISVYNHATDSLYRASSEDLETLMISFNDR